MEGIGTIILNSISKDKPLYYVVSEVDSVFNRNEGIIKANFEEDCVGKIEALVLAVTNADEIIDIEFLNGDDESFATFDIFYMKDGEKEAREYYFEVTSLFE